MSTTPADQNAELLQRLFVRGLGEELILHVVGENVMLGQLGLKKNRLTLSDTRYLTGVRATDVLPCFESGLLGMVSASQQYQWSSLTFHGLNQCKVKVDLSQTRGSRLQATRDAEGDDLMDFIGSVYRGFRLMLDHHFLPVVTLQRMQSKTDEWGFAVVDLRMAAIDLAAVRNVNDFVRRSTERHFEVDLIEENVQNEKFEELFGNFLPPGQAPPKARPAPAAPAPAAPAPAPRTAPEAPKVVVPISAAVAAVAPAKAPARSPAQPAPVPAPVPAVATTGLAPIDVVQHVLGILREVVADIGTQKAFALFERWAGNEVERCARALLQQEQRELRSVRDYFDAIAAQLQAAGERHTLVDESKGVLTHEIRDCVYREACRRSGIDPEGRWSTCAQAIPSVRSRAAAALDPRLNWSWTSCDRRAGHPCVFELSFSDKPR